MKSFYKLILGITILALITITTFKLDLFTIWPWAEFLINKISHVIEINIENILSINTLKYLAILSLCFVIDLVVLGYDKSAIKNIMTPNKSTRSDIYIFFLSLFGLWRYIVMFSFLLIGYYIGDTIDSGFTYNWLHNLNSPILQLLVYMIVYDFIDYWVHRFAHRLSWWWEIHRFHHSASKFNIITVARPHPLDLALGDFIQIIPMAILGLPIEQFFIINIMRSMLGKLQHSMIDWDFGILGKYLLMSPVAHRIHHSPHPEHWDKHYGHLSILWDRLFGTYYKGDFVNKVVGLSNTTDNEKGLMHDLVIGQVKFFKALFSKWSFKEGVLTDEEIKAYAARNPIVEEPARQT